MTAINSNRAIRGPVTAVPVVAGHGVRLVSDTVNNRIVVEADETVLFSTTTLAGANVEISLSENYSNFERIRIYAIRNPANDNIPIAQEFDFTQTSATRATFLAPFANSTTLILDFFSGTFSGNKFTIDTIGRKQFDNNTFITDNTHPASIVKIIGINRIAGGE